MKLALLLAVAVLFTFAACSDLIGIEHYEVAQGGSTGWQCTLTPSPPSAGSCVPFSAQPDAGELDAGFDDMGFASATVCNPVTNAGCTGSDACGLDPSGQYYVCLAAPMATPICGDCSFDPCGPGLFCLQGNLCVQTCCVDEDCGTGRCFFLALVDPLPDHVGLCTQ